MRHSSESFSAAPSRRPASATAWLLPILCGAALFAGVESHAVGFQNAQPIALTGWNRDTVFEVPAGGGTSSVNQHFDFESSLTFAESGVITGVAVNGLPTTRTFTSTAYTDSTRTMRTNSVFQFQPYNVNNTAYINGAGSVKLSLTSPDKYKALTILDASSSSHGNWNNFRVVLGFTDRADVQLNLLHYGGNDVSILAPDWGEGLFSWQTAILFDRVGQDGLIADGSNSLNGVQSGFGMFEAQIDLTQSPYQLDQFTLSSITLIKPPAYDNIVTAAFAVSGLTTNALVAPEPSSAILLVIGAAGMLSRRKRRA